MFRAARAGGNAEQEFNAFAQGPAAMGGGFVTNPIPPRAAGSVMNASQGLAWVHQFQQMSMEGGVVGPLPVPGVAGVITPLPVPGVAGTNVAAGPPMAAMFAASPGIGNMGMPVVPGVLATAPPAAMHGGPVDPLGGLTQEELDAKFAEFEAEYEAQAANDADFEHHMATWMAEHGPAAAQNEPAATTTTTGATAGPAAGVEATVRAEAAVTEKSTGKEDQDEVAKAAAQIAAVMGNDASEKFQNSRFLSLMRRAGNKEVVIEGDNFVDKETHETVATIQYPAGKENQEPAKEEAADH